MKGLLLVGASVVDCSDVVIIEADEADRFAQLVNEHDVADLGLRNRVLSQEIRAEVPDDSADTLVQETGAA